jgi:hypothetical protein
MLLVFADNMSLLLSDLVVAFDKGSEKMERRRVNSAMYH